MSRFVGIVLLVSLFCLTGVANAQENWNPEQLERMVAARVIWEKQQKIVDIIIGKDTAALENELKKGYSPNSYISGSSLLAYAIDFHRWDMVLLLLRYGADIHAPAEKRETAFSNLFFLQITLESASGRLRRDYYFYQCLSVATHYGRELKVTPKRGSNFWNASFKMLSARYTWELVSQKKVPVVWAAAFTNNIDLLLALNLQGADKPYSPTEKLFSLVKEDPQGPFPFLPAGQQTTPSYWVKKWAANAEHAFYQSADYEKVLQSF